MKKLLAVFILSIGLIVSAWAQDPDLVRRAETGDANAQFNLGEIYDRARGVERNEQEALKWYRLAAEQGLAEAQNNLGAIYESTNDDSGDYEEAVRFYLVAAEQGFADAQFNMGRMYEIGRGVTQNFSEAINWYQLASVQGDSEANSRISSIETYLESQAQQEVSNDTDSDNDFFRAILAEPIKFSDIIIIFVVLFLLAAILYLRKKSTKNPYKDSANNNESHNNNNSTSIKHQNTSISCPTCSLGINLANPTLKENINCTNCLTALEINIDSKGQFYAAKIQANNKNESDEDFVNTVEECFALLEISSESTPFQIKAVYRKKLAEYHPDKVEKLGSRLKELADKETKKLNSAYKILKDKGFLYE
jgi:hypothetical protein